MTIINFELNGFKYQLDDQTFQFYGEPNAPETSQDILATVLKAYRDKLPIPTKLNVGCGFRPFSGYLNLDYNTRCKPDVLRNLDEGLPFDDNKFEEIYTSHVIEHVKDVFFFIYEIWRVSKPGAKVKIICPNGHNLFSSIQPDHLRQISYDYFERWRPEHRSVQDELKQTRGAYFNIISKEIFNEERELKFELEVVKEEKNG